MGSNRHFFSQNIICHMESVCQTLIRRARHASAPQGDPVQLLRDFIEPVHRFLSLSHTGNGVQIDLSLRLHNAIHPGDFVHLIHAPAVGGDQPQIEHILLIHIFLACRHHVRLGHQKAYKETGTQRNNGHDSNIPSKGFENGLPQVFAHRVFLHYHSISAIS